MSHKSKGSFLCKGPDSSVEGKHEEKDEAGQRFVSRMFSRKQTLPKDVKSEDVVSNLSSEGVLTVTAPRNNLAIK